PEQHPEEVGSQQQATTGRREFHRGYQREPMVQRALFSSGRAKRSSYLRQGLHRTGTAWPRSLGACRREPEMLVAALDGRSVAEPHAIDGLAALREDREHAMDLAIGADHAR